MRAKLITGLVVAAVLILAGICWVKKQPAGTGSSGNHAGAEVSGGRKVKVSGRGAPHRKPSRSSKAQHAATGDSSSMNNAVSNSEQVAVDDPRLSQIEAGVGITEVQAALEYLKSKGYEGKAGELAVRLLWHWARRDVEEAAKWVMTMPAGEVRHQAEKNVAIKDTAAAINWLEQLPEEEGRDVVWRCAAYEIVRTNAALAMEIAIQLPIEKNEKKLIYHVALQWAGSDPEGAAQWTAGLPESALKERVQANIATAWGEKDPVRAAQYAVLSMKKGRAQDDAVVAIVQRWVQRDPEAAAKWVEAFPEGILAETAAENIIKLWPGGFPNAMP